MNDDKFNELIDDATHAVNNIIPDEYLDRLSPDEHSNLLVQINDALSPLLSEVVGRS